MPSYSLKIAADRTSEAIHIRFDAVDAAEALIIAHREAVNKSAELWRENHKVCTIRREPVGGDEFWHIS